MLFMITFAYTESSSRGGASKRLQKNKLIATETDKELVEVVDAFLADDKCGYRTNIEIVEIKRI